MWPPPYPRLAHLVPTAGTTRDDVVLADHERDELLAGPVVLEEKVDGANVMLWLQDGRPEVASRGGVGAMDRGGQLGPLRAWMGPRSDELRRLLVDGRVLYGEWLWRRHTVRYTRLGDWFIGLDVLERSGAWLDVEPRNAVLRAAGIHPPPLVHGPARWRLEDLLELSVPSALGDEPAEGVIVRRAPGNPARVRVAKLLAPSFRRLTDADFAAAREGNRLAE